MLVCFLEAEGDDPKKPLERLFGILHAVKLLYMPLKLQHSVV